MTALYRLLWRRAVLLWTALIACNVTVPLLADGLGPLDAMRHLAGGTILPTELRSLHVSLLLVATLTGLLVSRVRKELQHELFAWSLPDLQPRLLAAALPILAPIVAVFALAGWASAGWPAAVAFAALGFLLFTAPSTAWDPVPSALVSRGTVLVLLAALFRASELFAAAEVAPWAMTALGLFGGAVFLWREHSAMAARARPFLPTWPLGTTGEGRWMKESMAHRAVSPRVWRLRPDPARVVDWVRAAEYEIFGRYGLGWAGWALTVAGLAVGAVWLWADDAREFAGWCTLAALMHHTVGSSFLRRKIPHPLSRARQAAVTWWTCLLNNAAFCAVLGACMLVAVYALPPSPFAGPLASRADALIFLPFLFAVVPVLQGFQGVWLMGERARGSVAGVAGLISVVVLLELAVLAPALLLSGWTALALAVVLAVGVQGVFRVALNRFYATADLV